MSPSDDLLEFLRWWEGLPGGNPALKAYDDGTGVWTIGYGHTGGVKAGDTMTQDKAESILEFDALRMGVQVTGMVTALIDQHEYDALTSFAYNLGAQSLRTSTLLRLVNAGDMVGAAAQFPRWDHAGGKELAGLLKRRVAEMHIFTDGDYTGRP